MSTLLLRLPSNFALAALLLLVSNSGYAASGVLHAFKTDAAETPLGGLVRDAAGNLYGTTLEGGLGNELCLTGCGAVYKLTAQGDGSYTYEILYQFQGYPSDGYGPRSALTLDSAGNLYGTTTWGGLYDGGIAFELSPGQSGAYSYQILYSFPEGACSWALPVGRLYMDATGNLFVVTEEGGANCQGAVFKLSPGSSAWTGQILYSFMGTTDGRSPAGGVIPDVQGNLYGTTTYSSSGGGVAYELSPSTGGTWTEKVLYTFGSRGDGSVPIGELTFDVAGNLYGVTQQGGGTGSDGTVFELKPSASGWTETILHRFNQTNGSLPQGGIIFDAAGSIYGTTYQGGLYDAGVVYKLTPNGNDGYTESALHNFTGGNDGANPLATPIFDPAGNLYGTASTGGNADNGNAGFGTVFVLAPRP
jgi:uncharacterized repeat protein (TIGR03803 family)